MGASYPLRSTFFVSVISMHPGACVMAKGGLEFMTTAWGVTPQAQKTGTSPSWISTGSPKSGFEMSSMPMTDGSPMCSGALCN